MYLNACKIFKRFIRKVSNHWCTVLGIYWNASNEQINLFSSTATIPYNRKGHVVADTEAHPVKMGEEVVGAVKECGSQLRPWLQVFPAKFIGNYEP